MLVFEANNRLFIVSKINTTPVEIYDGSLGKIESFHQSSTQFEVTIKYVVTMFIEGRIYLKIDTEEKLGEKEWFEFKLKTDVAVLSCFRGHGQNTPFNVLYTDYSITRVEFNLDGPAYFQNFVKIAEFDTHLIPQNLFNHGVRDSKFTMLTASDGKEALDEIIYRVISEIQIDGTTEYYIYRSKYARREKSRITSGIPPLLLYDDGLMTINNSDILEGIDKIGYDFPLYLNSSMELYYVGKTEKLFDNVSNFHCDTTSRCIYTIIADRLFYSEFTNPDEMNNPIEIIPGGMSSVKLPYTSSFDYQYHRNNMTKSSRNY